MMTEEHDSRRNLYIDEPLPDEMMERTETAQMLYAIIKGLPEAYREIITLKEIDGLSYDEIAIIKDQNVNTLRVNLSRARRMIRDEFKKKKYEYTGNKQAARKVL